MSEIHISGYQCPLLLESTEWQCQIAYANHDRVCYRHLIAMTRTIREKRERERSQI